MMRRAALLGGLLVVLLVGSASPAAAHSEVESTAPSDGARLRSVPDTVSVTFSEEMDLPGADLTIVAADGCGIGSGPPTLSADQRTLSATMPPGTPAGSYLVRFSAAAQDSHPTAGAFAFVVGDGPLLSSGGGVSGRAAGHAAVLAAVLVLTWLSYVGLVLMGGLVLVAAVWQGAPVGRAVRNAVLAGCAITVVVATLQLLLHGPHVRDVGVAAAADPALLGATLAVPYGRLLLLRVAAAGVLAAAAHTLTRGCAGDRRATTENWALAAGLAVLLSFSAAGHSADDLPLITLLADVTHLGGVAVWLGALTVLAASRGMLSDDPVEARRRAGTLSTLAAFSVATVLTTGTFLATRTLGTPDAFWTTGYGALLALKLACVAVLLTVAESGRRVLHRTSDADHAGEAATAVLHRIRTTAIAELAMAAVLLVVVAQLVNTAPPA